MFDRLSITKSMGEIAAGFCAPVREWWLGKFAMMTPPQLMAVPAIAAKKNTLVCAPTGSGKTLCAFISVLSDLFERKTRGETSGGIECVYVSPLRALGSDVARNLLEPLEAIAKIAGVVVRVGMRTGDSTSAQRRKMSAEPPEILVTTPESLAICLGQQAMRGHLRHVRTIIVDELHALAANKRGVDLAVTLSRLAALVKSAGGVEPARIGLSATISPLETMAAYLAGPQRACAIADASFDRAMELEIAGVFGKTPFSRGTAISKNVYDTLERIIRAHRTTLVFTNTRAATERVVFQMRKRFVGEEGEGAFSADTIEAHHSSLDREMRLDVEDRLKRGVLRCVVCSTSLELGIDIGSIDRVVLLNSPKGVARGLQRVGRSGHSHGETSRGTFIPTVPADLVESIVTAEMMRQRRLSAIRVPENCLDVLSQQLIGMAVGGGEEGVGEEEAFEILRGTLPYANLSREDFSRCCAYIAGEGNAMLPKVIRENGVMRIARKSVGGLYFQNVGTITAEGNVRVKLVDGGVIGTVEEAFAQILKEGDRFILGGKCVRFVGSNAMTAMVIPSDGQQPTVPRWFSGQMGLEPGLAAQMRIFRGKVRAIASAGEDAIARMLMRQFRVHADVAQIAAKYLHVQHRYAEIPVEGELLVERVPDEDATALVFHTMIGRAANEAIARLVAARMSRRFGGNAAVVVDDYAFGVWVTETSAARRADRTLVRSLLSPDRFEEDLQTAAEASELFKTNFRFTAIRAHAILQNRFGRRRFIGQMQGTATRLYEALRETDPNHLLIQETRRTVMDDILNSQTALAYLKEQMTQPLRMLDLPTPSPLAFGLFASGKRDSLQLADTSDFLLAMYEKIQKRLTREESPPVEGLLF
jgi:ATP-dependent Lhr-like helicase